MKELDAEHLVDALQKLAELADKQGEREASANKQAFHKGRVQAFQQASALVVMLSTDLEI